VFASDRSGNLEIYSIRADGSQLGQLTRNAAQDTAPVFSPDGRRIVFNRAAGDGSPRLWLMNADGSGQRQLAANGRNPAWSPDSLRIAFEGTRASETNANPVVIMSAVGGGQILIRGRNHLPTWSPDGKSVAFTREVGDRIDLMVVGSDGRGLRTIRRSAGSRLDGWSTSGLIAFEGSYGSEVIGADGRGARLLQRGGCIAFAWSPDGQHFACAPPGGPLRVVSVRGEGRNLTRKNAAYLDAAAWSPDGRWVSVRSRSPDALYHDLLLVAADGTSSRPITTRVPSPWGSENGPPSWRPRGATPARLGGAPVAPSQSEVASSSTFRAQAPGLILALAADDGRVAVVVGFSPGCKSVEVWQIAPAGVVRFQRPCGPNDQQARVEDSAAEVALANTRVGWVNLVGGNEIETEVLTAAPARPNVAVAGGVSSEGPSGETVHDVAGHGALLVFTDDTRCDPDAVANGDPQGQCPPGTPRYAVVSATIWRIGGRQQCPSGAYAGSGDAGRRAVATAGGELSVLAVDSTRIAARTDKGISLLTGCGKVLQDFAVTGSAAALSGKQLAVRTKNALEIYDTDSGQLTARIPAASNVRLEDLEAGVLVTTAGGTVTLRKLANGRTTIFRPGGQAHAQLEQPGLYVSGDHLVTFTPMTDVLRRLGG
jgi:hypothetical protein